LNSTYSQYLHQLVNSGHLYAPVICAGTDFCLAEWAVAAIWTLAGKSLLVVYVQGEAGELLCGETAARSEVTESGFGGLGVSMLASGTQVRGFEPGSYFSGRKNAQHPFPKAIGPILQICGV
jgi:hypothetical protein